MENDFYERMTEDGFKRVVRILTLIINACTFALLIANRWTGLIHWVSFTIIAFWLFFLINLTIPSIDYDNSRKRARVLAMLLFASLILLFFKNTRNGVFVYDATLGLTFWYDNHFYGELLSGDMLKVNIVILGIEFLWVVFSTLMTLHIL